MHLIKAILAAIGIAIGWIAVLAILVYAFGGLALLVLGPLYLIGILIGISDVVHKEIRRRKRSRARASRSVDKPLR